MASTTSSWNARPGASEVSNREYQEFVNHGGYQKPEYWPAVLQKNGQALSWSEAMQLFRDTTGRPGPSTWEGDIIRKEKAIFLCPG